MARRKELSPHEPFAGAKVDIANILSALSGVTASPQAIPAVNVSGTGFMQLASALSPTAGIPLTPFTPGIPDPTGFELDPLGRGDIFATGKLGALPRLPVEVAPTPVPVSAPPTSVIPTVADLASVAVPSVADPTTRSIEELQSISSMLAPQVEAGPLTRQQLIGGDVFGLTPEQVQNVTTTRMSQLATKASTDKQALDFLRKSTGITQAEGLVKDKIREEGSIARAKFAADTQAEQSALATNRQIELEKWKAKTDLTNRLLVSKAEAAAEAATTPTFQEQAKEKKAQIWLEFAETNPIVAAGFSRIPDIDDSLTKLENDKKLSVDSPLKMSKAEHKFHSQIVTLGTLPSDNIEEVI